MMELIIRKAEFKDILDIDCLLYQVHKVHSDIRPDLFKEGLKKYTDEELKLILQNDNKIVFVAELNKKIIGHAFCDIQHLINGPKPIKSLYIDDICVDENYRQMHIASSLLDHVKQYAKENNFYNLTLNVWEGNNIAKFFYINSGFKTLKTTMEYKL